MSPKSRQHKSLKGRVEKRKTHLEITAIVIGIVAAILGIIQVFHPFRTTPEASVEIVELFTEVESTHPIIKLKLRNVGGSVAFLKRAELIPQEVKATQDTEPYAGEVKPVLYNWLITPRDLERKEFGISLSRKIDSNDADNIEFVLGLEQLKSKLEGTFRLRIFYNKDQSITTSPFQLLIKNESGELPIVILPDNAAEIFIQLQREENSYTTRQIIEELAKRKYEPATSTIRKFLGNSDSHVRVAATAYFSQVFDRDAIPELANQINDTDAHVRAYASKALIFHGEESIDELMKLLASSEPSKRELAVSILSSIRSPNTEELLLRAIEDRGVSKVVFGEEVLVAASAIQALSQLKSSKAVPKIADLLNDTNLSVQFAAIDAITELRIKYVIPRLINLLDSHDIRIRQKAREALVQISGKDFGASRKQWVKGCNAYINSGC